MAFLSTSSHHCPSTFVFSKTTTPSLSFASPKTTQSLSFPTRRPTVFFRTPSFPFFRASDAGAGKFDESGEKTNPEPEYGFTEAADPEPSMYDEEGKEEEYAGPADGSSPAVEVQAEEEDEVRDLKRSLVDAFYATDFGYRDSPEVRVEVSELVSRLEALNPTRSPVEVPLFDGTWVLM